MSAHTPGPWRANRNSAYWEVCAQRHRIEEGVPYSVADVCASDPNNADGGLQEANAHLIAAAPDLLEALDQITTEVEEILAYQHTCGDPWAECPLQDSHKPGSTVDIATKARAAIAKARGNT